MGLPGLYVVLGLATGAVNILVDGAAAHTIETGDDEACVDALRSGLDAGDDALDAVPACGAIVEFLGPGAARLHEEIVPIAARWIDPDLRTAPLRPYGEAGETRTLDL